MASYLENRSSIKSGDILAWSHRGIKSLYDFKIWLIRLFTQSDYSHVGIAWVFKGRVFVIEAVTPYVRIVPLSNLLPCYVVHIDNKLSLEAEEIAMSLVGRAEYSQWEAIKSLFGLNKYDDRWQCAEFVQEVCYANNLDLGVKDIPSEVVLAAQKLEGSKTVYLE